MSYEGDNTAQFEDVQAETQTDLALCVYGMDKDKPGTKCWVPFKVLHSSSRVLEPGDYGTIVVAHWWAEKAGLV